MTFKVVSRLARLLGFVLSPLLTAPAAAGELTRELPPAAIRGEDRPAVHARDLDCRGTESERGRRYLSF
jgi:hypothetical protein